MTRGLRFAGLCLAAMTVILVLATFLPMAMFGIFPRSMSWQSFIGIVASPFLHVNVQHFLSNATSFFVLVIFLFVFEEKRAMMILLALVLLSGFGTWLIGRSGTVHIGASGVIYGLIGYFSFVGFFKRKFELIVVSIATLFFYGGAVWGLLPSSPHISWEGHLSGFLSGILLAYRRSSLTSD